jgi:hypothetical protein
MLGWKTCTVVDDSASEFLAPLLASLMPSKTANGQPLSMQCFQDTLVLHFTFGASWGYDVAMTKSNVKVPPLHIT